MTKPKSGFGLYQASGDVMPELSSSDVMSLHASGNINVRRKPERNLYDSLLNGTALKLQVGEVSSSAADKFASPPAWTQYLVGKHHGFVSTALSSSVHDRDNLNAYFVGTSSLENTDVPATSSLYYSKQSRFKRLVYSVTASNGLFLSNTGTIPNQFDENGVRSHYNSVSGGFFLADMWAPFTLTIPVTDYGRIRDVKVWVEFVHDHRGGPGSGTFAGNPFLQGGPGISGSYLKQGLQGIQIALRSPNVKFPYSHPLWNDPKTVNFVKYPDPNLAGTAYQAVPELLRNSYLLWAGHACEPDLAYALGSQTGSLPDNPFSGTLIDSDASTSGSLTSVSVKMDKASNPYIAYVRGGFPGSGSVKHIFRTTGSWYRSEVERFPNTDSVGFTSLVLDDDRNSYVAYSRTSDNIVKVAKGKGSTHTWTINRVDTGSFGIVLRDKSNKIHLIYGGFGSIKHAVSDLNVSSWSIETIGQYDATGAAAACDSSGNLYVGWMDSLNSDIPTTRLAISSSNGWSVRAIDSGSFVSGLVVNSSGTIFLAGGDASGGSRRITLTIVSGSNVSVEHHGGGGGGPALTVDDSGNISFVYYPVFLATLPFVLNRSSSIGLSQEALAYNGLLSTPADIAAANSGNLYIPCADQNSNLLFNESIAVGNSAYFEYDTDIDMRTVFWDASPTPNPRNLSACSDVKGNTVIGGAPGLMIYQDGKYPSPASASFTLLQKMQTSVFPSADRTTFLTGANFPWMLDSRIPPGNFVGRSYSFTGSLGTGIPSGWLSGPSGTAGVNEWPTFGYQLGPSTIQPVYPLLDDVYVEKVNDVNPVDFSPLIPSSRTKLIGYRPGLRGSEIHGNWRLMFGMASSYVPSSGSMVVDARAGIWFRQARIEFIVDQGQGLRFDNPGRLRRYRLPGYVAQKPGRRVFSIISGSAAWDIGTNIVYTDVTEDYGRSVGITDTTASFLDSFAVMTRITGSLLTAISGSDPAVLSGFINNEFGTPYIPVSSASLGEYGKEVDLSLESKRTQDLVNLVVGKKTLAGSANTIPALISRTDYSTSREEQVRLALASGSV